MVISSFDLLKHFQNAGKLNATVRLPFINTEPEGFMIHNSLFKCTESPCWPAGCRGWHLRWAALPYCQGPVSNGDSLGNWMSW